MNTKIKLKLKELREFQKIYPESHCGGSIGLMLHGIDLQRDLGNSDLDITTPDEIQVNNEVYQERSDGNDFDYCLKRDIPSTGYYVKFDIRVCPEPSFEVVEFEGYKYNVSRLKDILFWKNKYAKKDSKKHIEDLETIKTGKRPKPTVPSSYSEVDDLPF
jgi:hypothetical protein